MNVLQKKKAQRTMRESPMARYSRLKADNLYIRRLWQAEVARVASGLVLSTTKRDNLADSLREVHERFLLAAAAVGRGPEVTS
ncbi:hypothetical protein [Burkholderia gladioli]|uniref:hypothetical protein n=1 Tax=Burkholderia gladioli TaxID=28095 RepID=UPI0016402627|nr:hypothetical protein [Burkholderia gladioli]